MPKPGEVLATCPCRRSLVSPNQSAIAKPVSTGRGMGISTKQPPTLKSEASPQITGCPSRCSSTEIEHFIRGEPPLNRRAEVIDRNAMSNGKIPERLFRAQIQQPYLTFARRACPRCPFHAEMHFALSVGQTDDFVHFNLRAHSAQPCPALTDVQGCNILREYLAVGVRPKDAHRHFHR